MEKIEINSVKDLGLKEREEILKKQALFQTETGIRVGEFQNLVCSVVGLNRGIAVRSQDVNIVSLADGLFKKKEE